MGKFQFELETEPIRDAGVVSDGKDSVSGTTDFERNLYVVWVILAVIIFNMVLINLIIAILANTYSIFDLRSTGLYLSKIL